MPTLDPVSPIILVLDRVLHFVVLFEVRLALIEMLVISLGLKILPLSWRCNLVVALISKVRSFELGLLIVGFYAFPHQSLELVSLFLTSRMVVSRSIIVTFLHQIGA